MHSRQPWHVDPREWPDEGATSVFSEPRTSTVPQGDVPS
jgi:hypothetical protein